MKTQMKITEELLGESAFGVRFYDNEIVLRVWSPVCDDMRVAIYEDDKTLRRYVFNMTCDKLGIWSLKLPIRFRDHYYTLLVSFGNQTYEIVDPYAVACGINSRRGMLVDVKRTNPQGWEEHKRPESKGKAATVLYEIHVRDFSIHPDSGMLQKGKYGAFTESGTTCDGNSTGLDHLRELGVTHVHLLPVYDFLTVDETKISEYNWGYDPSLFNVPEGSYSSNPSDGRVRIRELKQLIMALHEAGMRVILDVVYNHTYESVHSNFNRLVPDFWYRQDEHGNWTNGSGCGNELATEKPMVRKFILDSLLYWLETFNVDGFRFDLMGLYDVDTVKEISRVLHEKRPDILLYGEPWIGWESALPGEQRMAKGKQQGLNIALFNDDFRNAIKGDNDGTEIGFVQGRQDHTKWVKLGIAGSIPYRKGMAGFTCNASETVNYASSHDNLILSDKIDKTHGHLSDEDKLRMNRFALAIILTSFGIPFIQAGTEFGRTKMGHHNSYNAGDEINAINWHLKQENKMLYTYVSELIAFRKLYGFFSDTSAVFIRKHLIFKRAPDGVIVYTIRRRDRSRAFIVHNALKDPYTQRIPDGKWIVIAEGDTCSSKGIRHIHGKQTEVAVSPKSSLILIQGSAVTMQ